MSIGVTELLIILVTLAILLLPFAWWLKCLIQAIKIPDPSWTAAGQNKTLFVVLMIVLGILGTILYATIARPALKRVEAAAI